MTSTKEKKRTRVPGAVDDGAIGTTPLSISGLQLWLDFSDESTIYTDSLRATPVTSDGDVIGAIEDKSGNRRVALQTTTANKPLYKTGIQNSLSVCRFVSSDLLYFVTPSEMLADAEKTFFIVYSGTGAADYSYAMATRMNLGGVNNSAKGYLLILDSTPDRLVYGHLGSGEAIAEPTQLDDQVYLAVVSMGVDGTNPAIYLDGSSALTLTTNTLSASTDELANGYTAIGVQLATYCAGDLMELLVYDSILSDDDRGLVEEMLNGKWAVY